jgi:hypothetical protein
MLQTSWEEPRVFGELEIGRAPFGSLRVARELYLFPSLTRPQTLSAPPGRINAIPISLVSLVTPEYERTRG